MSNKIKFSIVTPSYNQGEYIEDTIQSLLNQSYKNFEHIVIDAKSTDNTLDVLSKYNHLNWISESDNGQADAINKGIKLAKGEIFAWLNSDDYYDKETLKLVAEVFDSKPEVNILFGDITYIDKDKNKIDLLSGNSLSYKDLIRCPDIIRQPSMFWRKSLFDEIGLLDEKFHLVMDFDFFLRAAKKYDFFYLPENLSYFRVYDDAKTQKYQRKQAVEIYKVYRKNNIKLNLYNYKYLMGKVYNTVPFLEKSKRYLFPKGIKIRYEENSAHRQ